MARKRSSGKKRLTVNDVLGIVETRLQEIEGRISNLEDTVRSVTSRSWDGPSSKISQDFANNIINSQSNQNRRINKLEERISKSVTRDELQSFFRSLEKRLTQVESRIGSTVK